ncbi:MAG: PatA/PatG family cyanobactin maturation protease [Hyphomicrobiales bacterium]
MLEALQQLGDPDTGVLIGIVDGLPDLECRALKTAGIAIEQSMVPEGSCAPNAHGTEICSLIFGAPPEALGLARGCSGLSLPIFFSDGDQATLGPASQMDLARALTIAVERGVSIINVSAGQKTSTPEAGRHLEDALSLCDRHGILVVAAAGNDGCACLHVQAAVSTVLAVGAMDDAGEPLEASNWGESYRTNGLLAPGVNLRVVGPGGKSHRRTGTSYATAVVSAVAARLLSAARRLGSKVDPLDVRSILLESSDPCSSILDDDCARALAGKLNVDNAIRLLSARSRTAQSAPLFRPTDLLTKTRETVPMGETGRTTDATAQLTPSSLDAAQVDALEPSGQVDQQACSCGGDEESDSNNTGVEASAASASETRVASPGVTQQACACGGDQPPQLVYAVGTLWFDFGTEARYDALVQAIGSPVAVNTPINLVDSLCEQLDLATGVTFILLQDQIPVYAIQPAGPFAKDIYSDLLEDLRTLLAMKDAETRENVRVAIPGYSSGVARLMNGMILPVLYPDKRGMVRLQPNNLAKSAEAAIKEQQPETKDVDATVLKQSIENFLVRVWDEMRNLGMSPGERALNYAATNAFQAATVFADAVGKRLELLAIRVSKSPICRPDSDCWDVQLQMFNPEDERRAGHVYRFTVDVSEVIPVTVGPVRSWSVPLAAM